MITGVHILLTYTCSYECDHRFVYSSPRAQGTFTLSQIRQVIGEVVKAGTVKQVFFEGGEPFLYYPLMVEGIRLVRENGLDAGIVTNAYWATTEEDAELWLRPLKELGIFSLTLSDDAFHSGTVEVTPASRALAAAKRMGIPVSVISIEEPKVEISKGEGSKKGEPIVGGSTSFRGRAVEKLMQGLPKYPWSQFSECPDEDLQNPSRIHVDAYGNVHLCQGISMGNMWQTPLSELINNYNCDLHPIAGPISRGGPARLAEELKVQYDAEYVSACHLCYDTRLSLIDRFPEFLAPRQVYGL